MNALSSVKLVDRESNGELYCGISCGGGGGGESSFVFWVQKSVVA